MPTFKHPCPRCGKFIERDVAACPFCGTADPFAPARCPNCRAVIEDLGWAACPKCGQPLATVAPPTQPAAAADAADAPISPSASPGAPSAICSGCRAPLSPGARFCTVCGTLAG